MDMPSANWAEQIPEIFAVTKWFLAEHQVFIMIGTAITLAITVLQMVFGLFDRNNDDDDGFDYHEV